MGILKRGKGTYGKAKRNKKLFLQCPLPNAQCPIPNSPYHMPRIEFVRLNTVLGGSANDADRET
jgi:hypothetical protein